MFRQAQRHTPKTVEWIKNIVNIIKNNKLENIDNNLLDKHNKLISEIKEEIKLLNPIYNKTESIYNRLPFPNDINKDFKIEKLYNSDGEKDSIYKEIEEGIVNLYNESKLNSNNKFNIDEIYKDKDNFYTVVQQIKCNLGFDILLEGRIQLTTAKHIIKTDDIYKEKEYDNDKNNKNKLQDLCKSFKNNIPQMLKIITYCTDTYKLDKMEMQFKYWINQNLHYLW
tara:strand:+ start:3332 stop:4006 length:675 start_codon:yes stop_codon:yes gene_type:complete